jgi:hypothetical protein
MKRFNDKAVIKLEGPLEPFEVLDALEPYLNNEARTERSDGFTPSSIEFIYDQELLFEVEFIGVWPEDVIEERSYEEIQITADDWVEMEVVYRFTRVEGDVWCLERFI